MYTFRIDTTSSDTDDPIAETQNSIRPTVIEFTDVVTQKQGFNKNKFREIKRPTVEQYDKKPRNMFMIFRGLIKNLILKKLPKLSFVQSSKIASLVSSLLLICHLTTY